MSERSQSLAQDFTDKYGVDYNDANLIMAEPALNMFKHMYYGVIDDLREEPDLAVEGLRLQGKAQVLWDILHIPEEIEEIRNSS
jgi:hypothetical protein